MSESAKRVDTDQLVNRATQIVNKAIAGKGNVASVNTTHGKAKSFEDMISEGIWETYVHDALTEVDAGRWDMAHETARNNAISSTVITLANQE